MRRPLALAVAAIVLMLSVPIIHFIAPRPGPERDGGGFRPVTVDGMFDPAEWEDAAFANHTMTIKGYGSGHYFYCPNHTRNSTEEVHEVLIYQKTNGST
ncbi:MAG: hypothetical protein FJ149_10715 [Euryarchaeota archaeon]|nr:hypothetical protein [Euryarchaeota archaeon]